MAILQLVSSSGDIDLIRQRIASCRLTCSQCCQQEEALHTITYHCQHEPRSHSRPVAGRRFSINAPPISPSQPCGYCPINRMETIRKFEGTICDTDLDMNLADSEGNTALLFVNHSEYKVVFPKLHPDSNQIPQPLHSNGCSLSLPGKFSQVVARSGCQQNWLPKAILLPYG